MNWMPFRASASLGLDFAVLMRSTEDTTRDAVFQCVKEIDAAAVVERTEANLEDVFVDATQDESTRGESEQAEAA